MYHFSKENKLNKTELFTVENSILSNVCDNLPILETKSVLQALLGVLPSSWVKKSTEHALL